jgi:hypothetical protein
MLQADNPSSSQGSYLEASVLLMYNGKGLFQELNHVVVLQEKSSQYGPGAKEPSDWTEDVPNGCKAEELKAFYGDGGRTNIQNLSGDWVVVDFLGGLLQLPMIVKWFPNPNNNRDAATQKLGKRFVLRRNNSEIGISNAGDFHITHRDGQYFQMKNRMITIKHRMGQMIHLDADGKIFLTDKTGNHILIDETGIAINNGTAEINVEENYARVLVKDGDADIMANTVNLVASAINAGSGVDVTTGSVNTVPLCVQQMAEDFAVIAQIFSQLITALGAPGSPVAAVIETFLAQPFGNTTMKLALAGTMVRASAPSQSYLTKILLGE